MSTGYSAGPPWGHGASRSYSCKHSTSAPSSGLSQPCTSLPHLRVALTRTSCPTPPTQGLACTGLLPPPPSIDPRTLGVSKVRGWLAPPPQELLESASLAVWVLSHVAAAPAAAAQPPPRAPARPLSAALPTATLWVPQLLPGSSPQGLWPDETMDSRR